MWKGIGSQPSVPCSMAGEVFGYLLLVYIEQEVMLKDLMALS